jgi:hypothetical protein
MTRMRPMKRSVVRELLVGTGAAYAATKVMDKVTIVFQERQSESSKRREKEVQEQPAYTKAAEKLAQMWGGRLEPEEAERLGQQLHMVLGLSGGPIAGLLAARGMNPVRAGILTGLGMWLLVDEGANAIMGFTPPAPAYPPETHLRGLVGHLAYGGVLGTLLGLGTVLYARRARQTDE